MHLEGFDLHVGAVDVVEAGKRMYLEGFDLHVGTVDIDEEALGLFPSDRQGQLDLLIDRPLQESCSIGRAEPLIDQLDYSVLAYLDNLAVMLHLALHFTQIQLCDLFDFILGQRRKHYNLVDAISELRSEPLLGRFQYFALDRLNVSQRLRTKAERLHILFEAVRAKV